MRKFLNMIGFTSLLGALCISFSGCGDCNVTFPAVYQEINNMGDIVDTESCEEMAEDLVNYYEENKTQIEAAFDDFLINRRPSDPSVFDLACLLDYATAEKTAMIQFYVLNQKLDGCRNTHSNTQSQKIKRLIDVIIILKALPGWIFALSLAEVSYYAANQPPSSGGGGGGDSDD